MPVPEHLKSHHVFAGGRFGIVSADRPATTPEVAGGHEALVRRLKDLGMEFHEVDGRYEHPERACLVLNPTRDQMAHLGKLFGQESVVFSQGGRHELHYTTGNFAGRSRLTKPGDEPISHFPDIPDDFYTKVPGGEGYFRINFDFDQDPQDVEPRLQKSMWKLEKVTPPHFDNKVLSDQLQEQGFDKPGPGHDQDVVGGPPEAVYGGAPGPFRVEADYWNQHALGSQGLNIDPPEPGAGTWRPESLAYGTPDQLKDIRIKNERNFWKDVDRASEPHGYDWHDGHTTLHQGQDWDKQTAVQTAKKLGLMKSVRDIRDQALKKANEPHFSNQVLADELMQNWGFHPFGPAGSPEAPTPSHLHYSGTGNPHSRMNAHPPGAASEDSVEFSGDLSQVNAANRRGLEDLGMVRPPASRRRYSFDDGRAPFEDFQPPEDNLDPTETEGNKYRGHSQVQTSTWDRNPRNAGAEKRFWTDVRHSLKNIRTRAQERMAAGKDWDKATAIQTAKDLRLIKKSDPAFGAQGPYKARHYPLQGKLQDVEKLVKDHGYRLAYSGGRYGQPDLGRHNYDTGVLHIQDPSSVDWKDEEYLRSYRALHELGHALTAKDVYAIHGIGRRTGGGQQAGERAVRWEWLAAHKQRELAERIGVRIDDQTFNRELNTVMGDAVSRARTGRSGLGFVPHSHKVPLDIQLAAVRQPLAKAKEPAFENKVLADQLMEEHGWQPGPGHLQSSPAHEIRQAHVNQRGLQEHLNDIGHPGADDYDDPDYISPEHRDFQENRQLATVSRDPEDINGFRYTPDRDSTGAREADDFTPKSLATSLKALRANAKKPRNR